MPTDLFLRQNRHSWVPFVTTFLNAPAKILQLDWVSVPILFETFRFPVENASI